MQICFRTKLKDEKLKWAAAQMSPSEIFQQWDSDYQDWDPEGSGRYWFPDKARKYFLQYAQQLAFTKVKSTWSVACAHISLVRIGLNSIFRKLYKNHIRIIRNHIKNHIKITETSYQII